MNGISRETYKGMEVGAKLDVLFDFAQENHRCTGDVRDKVEALERSFEKRKKVDSALSALGGVVGGVLAHFGFKLGE